MNGMNSKGNGGEKVKTCLLFKREKMYISLCTDHEYFSLCYLNFAPHRAALSTMPAQHTKIHKTSTHTNMYKLIVNSQVKTQILPLLKKIVKDEFADKVRVESVVDDFCPAKLQEK